MTTKDGSFSLIAVEAGLVLKIKINVEQFSSLHYSPRIFEEGKILKMEQIMDMVIIIMN